jgi:hypothetical protein
VFSRASFSSYRQDRGGSHAASGRASSHFSDTSLTTRLSTPVVRGTAHDSPHQLLLIASFPAARRFQFRAVGLLRALPEGFPLPKITTFDGSFRWINHESSADLPILPIQKIVCSVRRRISSSARKWSSVGTFVICSFYRCSFERFKDSSRLC